MADAARLWGWLGPDHADPLAGAPLAEAFVARSLGLKQLTASPPRPLDLSAVPAPRLTGAQADALAGVLGGAGLSLEAATRVERSLGQSYPDQLERRAGRIARVADGVALPGRAEEIVDLLVLAAEHGIAVTPRGGGTSVVGGLRAPADGRPWLVLDLARLNRIVSVSVADRTATIGAGMLLPEIEAALRPLGLTLGHFPQSFHGVTLGGAIAASGSGQRSDRYGRVADNLVSARIATPRGIWEAGGTRHASAGPWLGGLAAGSEGLFGVIAEATMRVQAPPAHVEDRVWLFADFAGAAEAVRTLAQSGHGLAMLRVSDEAEAGFLGGFRMARAGRHRPALAERLFLAARGAPARPAVLVAGYEGARAGARHAFADAASVLRRHGGVAVGAGPGRSWRKSRFETPHLREALMARGIGVDTFETAVSWSRLGDLHRSVSVAIADASAATLGAGRGRPAVFCHLSHSYPDAACLYFTAVFPVAGEPLAQWAAIKQATTAAIVAGGGSVSHHHGLGADHAPWAERVNDPIGRDVLAAVVRTLDPDGVMAVGASAAMTAPAKAR
jgi:alkyldihydroxyacetonephosphate synthase